MIANENYCHIVAEIFNNTAGSTYLRGQYSINKTLNDPIMVSIQEKETIIYNFTS